MGFSDPVVYKVLAVAVISCRLSLLLHPCSKRLVVVIVPGLLEAVLVGVVHRLLVISVRFLVLNGATLAAKAFFLLRTTLIRLDALVFKAVKLVILG